MSADEKEKDSSPAKDILIFECKLDKSKCDHEWNNEGLNPTHCLKCGQSFTAYAFMEMP